MSSGPPIPTIRIDTAETVAAGALLGIVTSLKPAPGHAGRSAVRGLIQHALVAVSTIFPRVALLDLRELPPPGFDGRMPGARPEPEVVTLMTSVAVAGALLLGVPAYWRGVSGVFKNFVDLLAGAAYDLDESPTVFAGKTVGLLVVGADPASAEAARVQAPAIMESVGCRIVAPPVLISDPRQVSVDHTTAGNELIALAALLARECLVSTTLGATPR